MRKDSFRKFMAGLVLCGSLGTAFMSPSMGQEAPQVPEKSAPTPAEPPVPMAAPQPLAEPQPIPAAEAAPNYSSQGATIQRPSTSISGGNCPGGNCRGITGGVATGVASRAIGVTGKAAGVATGVVAHGMGVANKVATHPVNPAVGTGDCTYRHYGPHDLFRQYYVPNNCGGPAAELYPAPHPVPPHVGHVYYTYQPLYPHEFLYPHHRTYHRYYDDGRGLTRTSVRWMR